MMHFIYYLFLIILIIGLVMALVVLYNRIKTQFKEIQELKNKESDLKTKEKQSNAQLEYETNRSNNFETIVSHHASPYFQGRITNPGFNSNSLAKKGEILGYLEVQEEKDMVVNDKPGYKSATTFKYNPFNQQFVHNASNTCVEASIGDLSGSLKTCDNNNNLQRWRLTDKHIRTIQDPNICLLATGKLKTCDEANTQLSIEPYDVNWNDLTKRKYV